MNADLAAVCRVIEEYESFALVGHVDPDGDCIGACMALAMALAKLGKTPAVVLEDFPERYKIIPGQEFLYSGDLTKLNAEVIIALDCGDISRLGSVRSLFERIPVTVCIDHHDTNAGFAQYNWIAADFSSTCEMVNDLLADHLGIEPCEKIATALYAGIVTDTGGFRFDCTSPATMEKTARLMATGIDFTSIYTELLHRKTFAAVRALGLVLSNARTAQNGRIVYSCVTQDELKAADATHDDSDGAARFLMNTRGAQAAVFFCEDADGNVRISLRSKSYHVGILAARWGGGGHQMAAGCISELPMQEVAAQILLEIEQGI